MRNVLKDTRSEDNNKMVGWSSLEGKLLLLTLIMIYDWEVSDDNEDYGKEETEDYEIADHDKGLENKMDEKEKTDEERLSDHKNFLGQWEMVKQFGVGLQG